MESRFSSATVDGVTGNIVSLFLDQVKDGEQTKLLPGTGFAACGQYLQHPPSNQRGLHGTAAAIQVLASSTSAEARAALDRLILYVAERDTVDYFLDPQKLKHDKFNVIKTSELLFALSQIKEPSPVAISQKDVLVGRLVGWIRAGKDRLTGWTYFGDDDNSAAIALLPTLYAMKALMLSDFDLNKVGLTVKNHLLEPNRFSLQSSFAIDVLASSVLVSWHKSGQKKTIELNSNDLRKVVAKQNRAARQWLRLDLESRIEYDDLRRFKSSEVRIAWQLLLLEANMRLWPFRFLYRPAQRRVLSNAIDTFSGEGPAGLRYPFSGIYLSSRTTAQVYEVVRTFQGLHSVENSLLVRVSGFVALVRQLAADPVTMILLRVGSCALLGFSLYKWASSGQLSDIGPEIISSAALFLATGRNR